jgi:hypothetical protein
MQLTIEEYLYIMSHLKSDEDVETIYNYLLKKNFFDREYNTLSDQEKIESAQKINLLCNEDATADELMMLSLSRCFNIPFCEIKKLPASIGRYLIRTMQDRLQPKEEKKVTSNNSLTDLILKSKSQKKDTNNSSIYKAPDEEILQIFKKQFGDNFNQH